MTQCFKDHEYDNEELGTHAIPVSECEKRTIYKLGQPLEVTAVPILTCGCIWAAYQREAEEIVAPGGVLIADPKERNRAINAAYARLWLYDNRFQWAGLAAFASKQVGCGLLHAADAVEGIQKQTEAARRLYKSRAESGLFTKNKMPEQAQLAKEYAQADEDNPVAMWLSNSKVQNNFNYVHDMLAMGNTSLFLDIFPLHAFYAKRGMEEFKKCLPERKKIFGHEQFPVLWPVGQERVEFGFDHKSIQRGFEAIEAGRIAESVRFLADHEQRNILQPAMYEDRRLIWLLYGNQLSYLTNFPRKLAQPVELTLASQCIRTDDKRTVDFSSIADLSDFDERMEFVLRAAAQFDELLNGPERPLLEKAIEDIAKGAGVR